MYDNKAIEEKKIKFVCGLFFFFPSSKDYA